MKVALYIYTNSLEDATDYLLDSFESRVSSSGGVFEDRLCLQNTFSEGLSGMFTTAKRIEIYDDEKISVTSSIQNINDISKVFTDYSQSFTIPASVENNKIFKHWYENSIDNGYDQRIKSDGFIEIDTQIFRVGKWQLEGATIKDNRIEDYKITFYGNLKSLLDNFGEDRLRDISTLNNYTVEYSGDLVKERVSSGVEEDIMFPLITSNRVWEYGTNGTLDISKPSGRINYTELFPALRVSALFDAIALNYELTFNGSFLTDERFTKAYLWFKNGESTSLNATTEPQVINFTSNYSDSYVNVNALTNEVNITYFPNAYTEYDGSFQIAVTFSAPVNSNLIVYKNGSLYTTIAQTGSVVNFTITEAIGVGTYTFEVQANVSVSYTYETTYTYFEYDPFGPQQYITYSVLNGGGTISGNLDLNTYAPDMKVSDFFSGILKMFNLTAFSYDGKSFVLEQLENWYYQGEIRKYDEYCISDFEFNRIKPYKKIDFRYQKSESITNRNFFNNYGREYGDLNYGFPYDGSEYNITLPFENIMFSKFNETTLQVGYAIKSDLQPYNVKPIILYFTEISDGTLYFDNGSGSVNVGHYAIFGQDMITPLSVINSMNWGIEVSSYFLNPIVNSLFSNYYTKYLSNLYSLKSRLLKVKMRLPYNELLNLKLNDRIVIRDKRYVINQYTTDLTTFESDFELIQDFRSLNFNNSSLDRVSSVSQTLKFFTTSQEKLIWTISSDPNGQIISITNTDEYVLVDVKTNFTGLELVYAIENEQGDVKIIIQDA